MAIESTESLKGMVLPSETQLQYHEEELAAFMHFSVNTFTGKEWGDGTEDPNVFAPSNFNPESMVEALVNAGFKRLIVTAKHHDGFCIWHTKHTDHNVANSEFGRDVLAEISAACTKYDLDMGIYLSPWDAHEPSYGYGDGHDEETDTNGDYNEFYLNQIVEICEDPNYGNNGKFVEWWLDGAKGEGADAQWYDFDRWIETIREHNPGINIFGAHERGGIHWVRNEDGFAPEPNWYTLSKSDEKEPDWIPDGTHWSVPEADVSINVGWFHHPGDKVKTQDQLAEIYFKSIGMGSTLLLNIPPTREGDFAPDAYEALINFRNALDTIEEPIQTANYSSIEMSSDNDLENEDILFAFADNDENPSVVWTVNEEFDIINIGEAIRYGQRVANHIVSIKFAGEDEITKVHEAATIGHKRLIVLAKEYRGREVESIKIEFEVLEDKTPLLLSNLSIHKLPEHWA